jgi:hypothetical protein
VSSCADASSCQKRPFRTHHKEHGPYFLVGNHASVGKTISQIVQFLGSPSQKLCTVVELGEEEEPAQAIEPNGKAQAKPPRAKPAAPRKNAKKAREQPAQPEEEPSQKRQRAVPKAAAKKPKAAAKKPAEKKTAKRKAAEVEAETGAAEKGAAKEDAAPQEEEPACVDEEDAQPDEEMQDVQEDPMQPEAEDEEAEECEDDEPAPGVDMHPGPPVIGGPAEQLEMPVEAVQPDHYHAYDGFEGQSGEEPEPPPPGVENVHDLVRRNQPAQGRLQAPRQEAPPVVPATQRPEIGSQASPCDAAPPGSHGRSQPPQLGPNALQPPLEGVATSGGCAPLSHDNGSVTKAGRARGSKKLAVHRSAMKASLGVAAPSGTAKKSAPGSKRGAQAVAAAKQVPAAVKQLPVVRCHSTHVPSAPVLIALRTLEQ